MDGSIKIEQVIYMLGFEKERVRQEFISAAEFPKFARVVREMVDQVRCVGPNPVGKDLQQPEKPFADIQAPEDQQAMSA